MTQIPQPDRSSPLGPLSASTAAQLAGGAKIGAPRSPLEPKGAEESGASGAAFRVLLERLEERARELSEQSLEVADASGLAGAVDTARASLADAMTLGERLLEAYREARLQGGAHTSLPENPS